jgi:hypothetical protein
LCPGRSFVFATDTIFNVFQVSGNILVKIATLEICVTRAKIIVRKILMNFNEMTSKLTAFDLIEWDACFISGIETERKQDICVSVVRWRLGNQQIINK